MGCRAAWIDEINTPFCSSTPESSRVLPNVAGSHETYGTCSLMSWVNLTIEFFMPSKETGCYSTFLCWKKIALCTHALYQCSQWQVAEKNLWEGERREGRRSRSKTCDCHRKKKKKERIFRRYSPSGICLALSADMWGMRTNRNTYWA